MLSAAIEGCSLTLKGAVATLDEQPAGLPYAPPRNRSSSPSPSTSAVASAGPSVESRRGMSGSRSKSTNAFSTCVRSTPRSADTSRNNGGVGCRRRPSTAAHPAARARAAGSRARWVNTWKRRSGQTTISESARRGASEPDVQPRIDRRLEAARRRLLDELGVSAGADEQLGADARRVAGRRRAASR